MSRAITISEYLSDWLTHIQKSRRRKTYLLYEGLLRNHVVPHVGRVRLCDVRRVHIRKLLDALSGHIGSRTLQLVHRVLRQVFAEAIEDGLLTANPCTRKDKPRHYTPDRRTAHSRGGSPAPSRGTPKRLLPAFVFSAGHGYATG